MPCASVLVVDRKGENLGGGEESGKTKSGYRVLHILRDIVKAVPLQAWSGPEGSMKLRFLDFMTTAQDGGKVVSLTHRPPLPPGNTLVLISVRG